MKIVISSVEIGDTVELALKPRRSLLLFSIVLQKYIHLVIEGCYCSFVFSIKFLYNTNCHEIFQNREVSSSGIFLIFFRIFLKKNKLFKLLSHSRLINLKKHLFRVKFNCILSDPIAQDSMRVGLIMKPAVSVCSVRNEVYRSCGGCEPTCTNQNPVSSLLHCNLIIVVFRSVPWLVHQDVVCVVKDLFVTMVNV